VSHALAAAGWEAERRRAFLAGLSPSLAVLLLITLVPAAALVVASFTPLSLTDPAASFRFDDPLVNYRQLLHDERFLASMAVQLKLSTSSVALQLLAGLGLALLLNGKSRLLEGARTAFLIPMVLPPIVVALIWKIMYTPDVSPVHRALESVGLPVRSLIADPDTALWAISLADTWQWFPFTMLMVLATLQMIPDDPLEAARLEGASRRQLFRHIVLPYLRPVLVVCGLFRPGLAATAVLCFIFSWNDFFYALILTRTNAITAPVAIVNFLQYEGWEWTKIAASGTLVMFPVVIFTVLVRKYLVRGLTAGAVKD
jgi:multiple sugar transport system permease protein